MEHGLLSHDSIELCGEGELWKREGSNIGPLSDNPVWADCHQNEARPVLYKDLTLIKEILGGGWACM